ncbi:hypothetical protein LTR10_003889 [Elasticomyces elasticus]|nr:hypothetical protein LTR10_003889 [Elasticomyces elasticus]KAK4977924.1 hypothetical protein LTR42_002299 [Elasticomyces elasticus]
MDKTEAVQVEIASQSDVVKGARQKQVVGNLKLLDGGQTILVPTPSPDPKDPLNLPPWRKWAVLILVSAYGCTAVVLASGLGPIFSIVSASYPGQTARANDLLTYPALFMGIGNLIAMPLALSIGRRPVFLASILLLVAGGIWCACSKSLGSHIAGRDIMSLAAGQSEALAPMIVQEIFFLHERGRKLAWFIFIECVAQGIFFVVSTYMTSAWGWRWWYGFFTIFNAIILALSLIFVTETLFDRPEDASTGAVELEFNEKGDLETGGEIHKIVRVTTAHGVVLEPERFGPRTWRHDLRIFSVKPRWVEFLECYKHIGQGFCVPSMFWLLLMNGSFLGLYIFEASTFAGVLLSPPYSFSFNSLGYVQAGQVLSCLIFLPVLGYGSDWVVRVMSRRNGGNFKPEYRLLPLWIPAVVCVVCAIIYGQSAAHPKEWHWSAPVVAYNASFFAFLGANVVGITYAVESFPLRAAPLLVVLCAGRGFISFGLAYATLPSIQAIGYDGATLVEGIIAGVLALMTVPVYLFGPRIRAFGQKAFAMGSSKEAEEQ